MTINSESACPIRAEFDPLSATYLADPFAVLESVRDTPVFYAPLIDYYVVTRYAEIESIFLDEQTYSAAPTQLPLVDLGTGGGEDSPCRRTRASPEHERELLIHPA